MNLLGANQWLVYVLPGFVALFTAGFVGDIPAINDVRLPIYYVALTFISVLLPLIVVNLYGIARNRVYYFDKLIRSYRFILAIFGCSIFFGLFAGIAHNTNFISNCLRAIFGPDLVLISSHTEPLRYLLVALDKDYFPDRQPHVDDGIRKSSNRYVKIFFEDRDEEFEGQVSEISSQSEDREIYLSPACVIKKGEYEVVKGPGVWVSLNKLKNVEFIYDVCSRCASKIEIEAGQVPSDDCPFGRDARSNTTVRVTIPPVNVTIRQSTPRVTIERSGSSVVEASD